MAVSTENSNLVWQKVKIAFESLGASKSAREAFRELKTQLASVKGNPDLQFVPFSAADIVANTGYSPIGAACRVVALYAKNSGSGDGTDSYIALHDAADNASATMVVAPIQDDNDEIVVILPQGPAGGIGIAFATDLTISAATAAGGATESAEANAANGFVLVLAA